MWSASLEAMLGVLGLKILLIEDDAATARTLALREPVDHRASFRKLLCSLIRGSYAEIVIVTQVAMFAISSRRRRGEPCRLSFPAKKKIEGLLRPGVHHNISRSRRCADRRSFETQWAVPPRRTRQ